MSMGLVFRGFVPTAMELDQAKENRRRYEEQLAMERAQAQEEQRRWDIQNRRAEELFPLELKAKNLANQLNEQTFESNQLALDTAKKVQEIMNEHRLNIDAINKGDVGVLGKLLNEYNSNQPPFNDNTRIDVLPINGKPHVVFIDVNTDKIVRSEPYDKQSLINLVTQATIEKIRFTDPTAFAQMMELAANKDLFEFQQKNRFDVVPDALGRPMIIWGSGKTLGPFGPPRPMPSAGGVSRAPTREEMIYQLAAQVCKNSPNPSECILGYLRENKGDPSPQDVMLFLNEAESRVRTRNPDFDKWSSVRQNEAVRQEYDRMMSLTKYGAGVVPTPGVYDSILSGNKNPLAGMEEIANNTLNQLRQRYNTTTDPDVKEELLAEMNAAHEELVKARAAKLQSQGATASEINKYINLMRKRWNLSKTAPTSRRDAEMLRVIDEDIARLWRNISGAGVKVTPLPDRPEIKAGGIPRAEEPQIKPQGLQVPTEDKKPAKGLTPADKQKLREKLGELLKYQAEVNTELRNSRGTERESHYQRLQEKLKGEIETLKKQLEGK